MPRADPKRPSPPRPEHSEACLHCPNCSERLIELKCKLMCEKCGYYMSCADFY